MTNEQNSNSPAISLVVIARNESENIQNCLDSVTCCQEKLVIDSDSTDDTREISVKCGARVVRQSWLGFGPQRNFGAKQAKYDWILFLDADETLTPELNSEIRSTIKSDSPPVYSLPRQALYMGKPMRFYRPMTGERLKRLYDRRHAEWSNAAAHEELLTSERVGDLRHPFLHHHSPTIIHKHLKFLQYAELLARQKYDRKKHAKVGFLPFVYAYTFLKDYLWRGAIGDGGRGIIVAHVAATYACYKRLRLFEMNYNPESISVGADKLSSSLGWQKPNG